MPPSRLLTSPTTVNLAEYNPDDTDGLSQAEATDRLKALQKRISDLQELLFAAAKNSLLIILQGPDTSGKDGTVNFVLKRVNPVGCRVVSFKVPTEEERSHDFLWRIHQQAPARGMLTVFNRSQYEDVLAARVHTLVPQQVWQERYQQINDFEQMLTLNGTILLKFYLDISKDEQKRRLLARERDPTKAWKLSAGDWKERAYWNAYRMAAADALGRCATVWAPWYIVPANKKWYRNYVVTQAIVDRLVPYERQWMNALRARGDYEKAEIRAARQHDDEQAPATPT